MNESVTVVTPGEAENPLATNINFFTQRLPSPRPQVGEGMMLVSERLVACAEVLSLRVVFFLQCLLATLCLLTPVLVSAFESANCLIEPAQTVELASPVTGLLAKVYVQRGDRVTRGQVLAHLGAEAEEAALELARFKSEQRGPAQMAQSKIDFAQRKFQRRREMAADRLLAVQERDDAEAELKQAEAELLLAQENRRIAAIEARQQNSLLALRTLRSPFDGVVVEQQLFPGEVVEPGGNKKSILKLAQLDPLRVQLILPKEVFGKIARGMQVNLTSELSGQAPRLAKVKSVDRLIDAASGTFVVVLEMANPKLEIPAGVKCKAVFAVK